MASVCLPFWLGLGCGFGLRWVVFNFCLCCGLGFVWVQFWLCFYLVWDLVLARGFGLSLFDILVRFALWFGLGLSCGFRLDWVSFQILYGLRF